METATKQGLIELREKFNIPTYVTLEQLAVMMKIIEQGKIHPMHGACDMTLEISAGVDLMRAIRTYVGEREKPSRYAALYHALKE